MAVRMKLPTLIRRTSIPASAAATSLPPTAEVCRPQRVWRSTICMKATIKSAQMISE
jgi:hypothetical protein